MAGDKLLVDIIPGRLKWAPAGSLENYPAAVSALSLCAHEATKETSNYGVTHYGPKAYGQAFGPLSIVQTLRFCSNLHGLLEGLGKERQLVTLVTPPEEAAQANTAVLLGAYLIFFEARSSQAVACVLGPVVASIRFPCSWAKKETPESRRTMRVSDCWQGFALARDMNWLAGEQVCTASKVDDVCGQVRYLAQTFDAAWIVPGKIMVFADPVTTLVDPNPRTCSLLAPEKHSNTRGFGGGLDKLLREPSTASFGSTLSGVPSGASAESSDEDSTCDSSEVEACAGPPLAIDPLSPSCKRFPRMERRGDRNPTSPVSVASVAKSYQPRSSFSDCGSPKVNGSRVDFLSFLQSTGVGLMLRANFSREQGMDMASYKASVFEAGGIRHVDLPWKDHGGACPKPEHVAKLLGTEPVDELEEDESPVVAIHCKSGFGRSVLLASLLVVVRFDVSGRAALGWARVVRPGAITTPEQEELLCSFRGRRDVYRFAGKEDPREAESSPKRRTSSPPLLGDMLRQGSNRTGGNACAVQ